MVDDDRTKVRPKYRHSNVMAASKWLSTDKVEIYPIDVNHHSVQVEYTYSKQYGQQKFVGLRYFCTKCDCEVSVEHDYLYEEPDVNIATARAWMQGYFLNHDCI